MHPPFYSSHQDHHRAAQFIRHTRDIHHFRRRLRLLYGLQGKTGVQQPHQNLRQGMVLLPHRTVQEIGHPLTGQKIVVNWPVERCTVLAIGPILMHPRCKTGVLNVHQEGATRL